MLGRTRCALAALAVLFAAATGLEAQSSLLTYGYFASRWEKVFDEPFVRNGQTLTESPPAEFSQPAFHVMMQQSLGPQFRAYINLAGPDAEGVEVRNVWGEYSFDRRFAIRFGPQYRRFGLYNEILDAVPTYYGIEPPEMFDGDHFMISRTTTFSALGAFQVGGGQLEYMLSTDNGEGDIFPSTFPLGWDLRYQGGAGAWTVGASGYTSGGATNSGNAVGSGPSDNGVLPWMAADSFTVVNLFAEWEVGALTLQAEWARADHEAERDVESVLQVVQNGDLFDSQLQRFLLDPNGPVTAANVNTVGDYVAETFYFRAGYSFETDKGELAPYFLWDWYSNPETIRDKGLGGDNEAGAAEDGEFHKPTLGLIYRPIPEVAIKLDGSQHWYRLNGEDVRYSEIRFDVSYTFGF
jgi:hypothetical protein